MSFWQDLSSFRIKINKILNIFSLWGDAWKEKADLKQLVRNDSLLWFLKLTISKKCTLFYQTNNYFLVNGPFRFLFNCLKKWFRFYCEKFLKIRSLILRNYCFFNFVRMIYKLFMNDFKSFVLPFVVKNERFFHFSAFWTIQVFRPS